MKPVAQPYQCIPLNLRVAIEAKINQLMYMDIIKPVDSLILWVYPVVIVLKADKDVRLSLDMRQVIQVIGRAWSLIPMVERYYKAWLAQLCSAN